MDASLLAKIGDTSKAIPLPQTALSANETQLNYVYSEGRLESNKTIVTTANTSIIQKDSQLQLTYGIWNGGSESIKYVSIPTATDSNDGLLSYGSKVKYDNYDIRITTNDASISDVSLRIANEVLTRTTQIGDLQNAIDTINNTTLPNAVDNLETRLDAEYRNRFELIEGKFNTAIKDVSTLLANADETTTVALMKTDTSLNASINIVYETLHTLIDNVSDGIIADYQANVSLLENRIKTIEETGISTAINDLSTAIHVTYDSSIVELYTLQDTSYKHIVNDLLPLVESRVYGKAETLVSDEANQRKITDSSLKTDIQLLEGKVNAFEQLVIDAVNNRINQFIDSSFIPRLSNIDAQLVQLRAEIGLRTGVDNIQNSSIGKIETKIKEIETDVTSIRTDIMKEIETLP